MANNVPTLYYRLPGVGCVFKTVGEQSDNILCAHTVPFFIFYSLPLNRILD